ncbi:class I adenylate cyclase [Rodentibacter caecimuris]|uniref:Adenylate cyclase n=1 Tax=Rodentibacter caecimuris TaxID=1796644 RepID=A0ABX3KX90_9PAST|nr:adenylate cyclase [Rodentibacter heylii]
MKQNLTLAKKVVMALDKRRLERALLGTTEAFQWVFAQITFLLQYNHINLPGYIPDVPSGIADFELSDEQKLLFIENSHYAEAVQSAVESGDILPAIRGVYAMGSFGSISQTFSSDLDIWVCYSPELTLPEKELLAQKLTKLEQWAMSFGVEIHFFLMDQQRFRHSSYAEPLSAENSGSAQYMLLLDEFYRSALRLAGKPLLWLHLWVEDESRYDSEVQRLVQQGQLDLNDWVDFGSLSQFSAKEYFGASLWQLNKGVNAPYKSVLKIILLEAYSQEYPNTQLIARQFKREMLTGNSTPEHHFDPYLAILSKVTQYLTALADFRRLDFVRRCFYIKATEDFALYQADNWRIRYMRILAQEWEWSPEFIAELDNRPYWKIKRAQNSHDNVVKLLMLSYRNLVHFARKHHIDASVAPGDMNILTRKLCSTFEELPGKVVLLGGQISYHLEEEHLTFIEIKQNKHFKAGWYVVNRSPSALLMFSKDRFIKYGETLNNVVAWAYFNHLLTLETQLHIFSDSIKLETLRKFVSDLRLSFSNTLPVIDGNKTPRQGEIDTLFIAVNLSKDVTEKMKDIRLSMTASDLFSFGSVNNSVIGSIDLTYLNIWNEIRTLHFEGQNAILAALKELSNKIHRGERPPKIQVFCYSKRYCKTLCDLVSVLIKRYIRIKIIGRTPVRTNRLRVASKNWQLFFEGKKIIPSEIQTGEVPDDYINMVELPSVSGRITEEKANVCIEPRKYPLEIDTFAIEGFIQFFFEDNDDETFNVYILDELNHIEIYRRCEGSKEDKIYGIYQIYQSSVLIDESNPYKIEQRDFNYPQFYQLQNVDSNIQIIPFRHRVVS